MEFKQLTGNKRYRKGLFGTLILQVEESGQTYHWEGGGSHSPTFTRWRDAKITDLTQEVKP